MSRVLAVVGLAIILMVGVPAIQSATEDSKQATTITNETWTPDTGNITVLDHSNIETADYDETVDVRDENGTTMSAGDDYRWYQSNGTIKTLSDGRLTDDDTATITYGYNASTTSQQTVSDTSTELAALAGYLPYVLAAVMLISAAALIGGN